MINNIKLHEVYYRCSNYTTSWIKVESITENHINFISSDSLINIESVNTKKCKSLFDTIFVSINSGSLFIEEYNLDLVIETSDKYMDLISPLNDNKTFRDEINTLFNGNIKQWMKFRKLTKNIVPKSKNGIELFKYKTHQQRHFIENSFLLPCNVVMKKCPNLYETGSKTDDVDIGLDYHAVKCNESDIIKIKRDYLLSEII